MRRFFETLFVYILYAGILGGIGWTIFSFENLGHQHAFAIPKEWLQPVPAWYVADDVPLGEWTSLGMVGIMSTLLLYTVCVAAFWKPKPR